MKKRFFQFFAVMVVAVSATALLTSSELIKKGKYYSDADIANLKKEWLAEITETPVYPTVVTPTAAVLSRDACTPIILDAKKAKGVTYQQIAEAVGRSETWTTSVIYGENTMDATEAKKLCDYLGLGADVMGAVQNYAYRGNSQEMPPTDPLIYRFYEINLIYGNTMRAIIHEKFGEGIMSAIDYNMNIEKIPNPNGDRVRVTLEGKFLQYKKW
ncbi:MAG: cyanase [Chitinophagales bacterium]